MDMTIGTAKNHGILYLVWMPPFHVPSGLERKIRKIALYNSRLFIIKMPKSYSKKRKRGRTPARRRGVTPKYKKRITNKKPLALKTKTFVERTSEIKFLNIGTPATAVGQLLTFSMNDIAQVGNYIELFDEYRLDKAVVTFRYKGNGNPAITELPTGYHPVNEINPVLYFKVDHNDKTMDTLTELRESSKTRTHQFTNSKPEFSVVLKPAALVNVNNIDGALGISYRPKWKLWLPSEENAIDHYGVKCYAIADGPGGGGSDSGQLEITAKIYFSMKNND